ncbi:MAG: cytochrome c oxidase subunit 4 [bacterium]
MFGLALVIGAIFEVAALVFFVVADDPHMAFMLAITGLAMGLMTYILLYAQDTAEQHAEIPEWKKFRGKHSPAATAAPAGVHLPPSSIMPIAICAGAAVMFFGLAVNMPFFTLGTVMLGIAMIGWLVDSRREWKAVVTARGGAIENPTPLRPSRRIVDVLLIAFFSLLIGQSAIFAGGAKADPGPTGADPLTPAITASGVKFNLEKVVIKAGTEVTLTMTNKDSGIPHNFAIVESGTTVFSGDQFSGIATEEYTIPALDANKIYTFRCEVHPNMKGTIELVP